MNYSVGFLSIIMLFSISGYTQTSLSGYVIEMATGEPILNTTVFIHDKYNLPLDPPLRTKTDSTGYYELPELMPGKYSINAYVLYEIMGDSMAYVYQPGEFTIPESLHTSTDITYNLGFSEIGFRNKYFLQQSVRSG